MLAALFLCVYITAGIIIIKLLLPTHSPMARIWLGVSLGFLLLMWLPALMAFIFNFSLTAHWVSLILLALLTMGAYLLRDKRPVKKFDKAEKQFLILSSCIVIPLLIFSAYLQYTHNIKINADGSYSVGQSTYGDLSLHLTILTGLQDASFPPDYSVMPGVLLSYPFLMDSLSTSLYMLGFSLQACLNVPGTLMMGLCYFGFLIMAREMAGSKAAVILAFLLFFLNGGLGFLYDFDQSAGEVGQRVSAILEGYYKTPTNQPDPNNLRWSNVIADLMLPQRTLLGGWAMGIPCIYMLYKAFAPNQSITFNISHSLLNERSIIKNIDIQNGSNPRLVILLGIWAGALPLIHTHTFMAIGLISVGFLLYDCIHARRGMRLDTLLVFLIYGAIAACIALPQLIKWTFPQSLNSNHFIKFQFNWANNPGGNGLRDLYLWYYIKNIGIPAILIICALCEKNKRHRFLASGAFCIFIIAEFIRFQPNEYDNNKLFYIWYMLCSILAADYAVLLFNKLKGLRSRYILAGFTCIAFFLSAGLTLWREALSDYQAYSKNGVKTAAYIQENTNKNHIFMTGTQHLNPLSALAGRRIVCGPDLWLYYHGLDTTERKDDIKAFYTYPEENMHILAKYNVRYIMISNYERNNYSIDYEALERQFLPFYTSDDGEYVIYEVPDGILMQYDQGPVTQLPGAAPDATPIATPDANQESIPEGGHG